MERFTHQALRKNLTPSRSALSGAEEKGRDYKIIKRGTIKIYMSGFKKVTNPTQSNINGFRAFDQEVNLPAGKSMVMETHIADVLKETFSWLSLSDASAEEFNRVDLPKPEKIVRKKKTEKEMEEEKKKETEDVEKKLKEKRKKERELPKPKEDKVEKKEKIEEKEKKESKEKDDKEKKEKVKKSNRRGKSKKK